MKSLHNLPGVGERCVGAVLLDVHAEEADINAVDLLKREHRLRSVRKCLLHLASVHKPATHENDVRDDV